jgi:hypothetical protein
VSSGGTGITRNGVAVPERQKVGVSFDCPCGKCGIRCYIPFTNPADGLPPEPQKNDTWERRGETFEALDLKPSIMRTPPYGCGWHGYVNNGEVVAC